MQKEKLIQETLKELFQINEDIDALRSRLESGLLDDNQILINYKYLIQAIEMKNELTEMLTMEFGVEASLVELWQDIKKAN